jgi:hypothetical protein
MGDRANVQFVWPGEPEQVINLYAHWAGGGLARIVVQELRSDVARARWGDPPYLCRIVVQRAMNRLFDDDNDAGGGLSPDIEDNEHQVLRLFMDTWTYEFGPATGTWEELCALNLDIVESLAG